MSKSDRPPLRYVEKAVSPGYTYFIRNGNDPVYCVTVIGITKDGDDNAISALIGHPKTKLVHTWVRTDTVIIQYAHDIPLFFDPDEEE